MSAEQIDNLINQLKNFKKQNIVNTIIVTGGEPLLHPNIEEIYLKLYELKKLNIVNTIHINSNKILEPPASLSKYIVNYSLPINNPDVHNVALLHPTDFGGEKKTYSTCTHYRKNRVVLNYLSSRPVSPSVIL